MSNKANVKNTFCLIQTRIQEKNEPPQNFPVSRFYPIIPDFSQRFPDFSLTKFFKVRKCEFLQLNVYIFWFHLLTRIFLEQ